MGSNRAIDLTGQRFGRLVVVSRSDRDGKKSHRVYWNCQCDCGCTSVTSSGCLRNGHTKSCGCLRREMLNARIGSLNPYWNPKLTDEERIQGRKIPGYEEWRFGVFQRDSFTCQRCGDSTGGNLIAHHLEGYAENPEVRIELSNGITLCEHCHSDFHHLFGSGNNTREQYEGWINE